MMITEHEPVLVTQKFSVPVQKVWKAITNPDQMKAWFFENIPDFKPEVGFNTRFNVDSGEHHFMHLWEITEVIPGKRIVYNWRYEGYPGNSFVVFELFDEDKRTCLKLSHLGVASFPDDIPEFTRESCLGGWNYFIKNRLKTYLE